MAPGWEIWLICHLWKGRKPENERWALENQNMRWLGSRFLELYLLDSTSKTFLDSRFPYVGGKFPTYPSNWVIYREYYMYYNKRYFVPQLWEEIFAQNLIYMYTKMYDYDYVSLHVFTSCQPAKSFFNIAKDRKIMCTDRKLVLEFCIRLLVYSKCQIKWNSGPKLQTDRH